MSASVPRSGPRSAMIIVIGAFAATLTAGVGLAVVAALIEPPRSPGGSSCGGAAGPAGSGSQESIVLGPPGAGQDVGATEYGGPGDPSSSNVGAAGISLVAHPDSFAELGGQTFQTAAALGGLPYMTPLRVTWRGHSAVAYKRDFGLGGGPVDGLPRVIDLWWQFAQALGIPYSDGLWSGPVMIERPPATGAGNVLGGSPALPAASASPAVAGGCAPAGTGGLAVTSGPRATLLPDGLAAAPTAAPAAVKAMIAAGNQIVGKPYVYGAGHGVALDEIAPAYDCSSSVEHLLYGAGLVAVTEDESSGALESFGAPGPGRWVTIYASADHVFMYVAGLRWDTHNAAGPGDGSAGIGWHPLVRSADGFVARHPVGL